MHGRDGSQVPASQLASQQPASRMGGNMSQSMCDSRATANRKAVCPPPRQSARAGSHASGPASPFQCASCIITSGHRDVSRPLTAAAAAVCGVCLFWPAFGPLLARWPAGWPASQPATFPLAPRGMWPERADLAPLLPAASERLHFVGLPAGTILATRRQARDEPRLSARRHIWPTIPPTAARAHVSNAATGKPL